MLAHYSHVRLGAKRKVLDTLAGGGFGGSYDTNHDTNPVTKDSLKSQVIDKNGGADGIRTHDLLDAIEARSQLRHGPTEGFQFTTIVVAPVRVRRASVHATPRLLYKSYS